MTLTVTDLPVRIRLKIDTTGPVPADPHTPVVGCCWTFDSWHNSAGYPYLSWNGRDQPAHRIVFALITEMNVTGLDVDHLCRNTACVNPSPTEAVPHAENQRRISKHQVKCRKAGHDWSDPRNVSTRPNGRRYCTQCYRQGNGGHIRRVSDTQLIDIRRRANAGETQISLATEFGISSGLVSKIANRKYPVGRCSHAPVD